MAEAEAGAAPPLSGGADRARSATPAALPSAAALFREHGAQVFRLLRRLGVRDADVDDVCQEVFVAVHRQLPSFEGRSKLSTWIFAIASRRAASYRRRAYHNREMLLGEPPEPAHGAPDGDPGRALEDRRARELLDALLDTLDEDKRLVFVLYEIEELPMREVVEVIGCPLQTGYSRLHAARERLKQEALERGLGR